MVAVRRRNYQWSLGSHQGHRDDSICLTGPAMKSTSCQRRRDDNESEDNRLGDASLRSQPRMRSVKPNCLRDKSSVSSVASRLCSPLSSTHLRVRALSFVTHSFVIRYTWEQPSRSFSVWFVRISGCRHARLTVAARVNREERSCSAGEIEARPLRHLLLRS